MLKLKHIFNRIDMDGKSLSTNSVFVRAVVGKLFGTLWGILGASWKCLGSFLGLLGAILGVLDRSFGDSEHSGTVLAASWRPLGPSLGPLVSEKSREKARRLSGGTRQAPIDLAVCCPGP